MPETNPCCLTEKSGGQKAATRTLLWGKRAKELVNSQSPPLVKNATKVVEVRANVGFEGSQLRTEISAMRKREAKPARYELRLCR